MENIQVTEYDQAGKRFRILSIDHSTSVTLNLFQLRFAVIGTQQSILLDAQ